MFGFYTVHSSLGPLSRRVRQLIRLHGMSVWTFLICVLSIFWIPMVTRFVGNVRYEHSPVTSGHNSILGAQCIPGPLGCWHTRGRRTI